MSSNKKGKQKEGQVELPESNRSGSGSSERMNTSTAATNEQGYEPVEHPKVLPKTNRWKQILYLLVGILAAVGTYKYLIPPNITVTKYSFDEYRFQVFCPVNKIDINFDGEMDYDFNRLKATNQLRVLTQQAKKNIKDDGVDKYLIYVKEMNISSKPKSSYFFYCSYVTDWLKKDCSKAQPICTVPGPIFYVEKNQPIDVAWVYNIEPPVDNSLNLTMVIKRQESSCYANPFMDHCVIQHKAPGSENCVFLDPTNQIPYDFIQKEDNKYFNYYHIAQNHVPIDVHIHGLEVRPTFDGNPLSWFGVDGSVGPGFQSLLNQKYYSLFRNSTTTGLQADSSVNRIYTKVNRYQNFQPPGNLWYHDHSMHVTMSNVALGMAGDYIIYDKEVNKNLPTAEYEILIVTGQNFNNSVTDSSLKQPVLYGYSSHRGGLRRNPTDIPFHTQTNLTFQRNQTYRIRILNGQYDSVYDLLAFKTECDERIKPRNKDYVSSCKKTLNFSVIGADSSLFDKPVHKVNNITLASAERYQILIIFDGHSKKGVQNQIDKNAKTIVLTTQKPNDNSPVYNIYELLSQSKRNNFDKFPSQVSVIPGVTFYDLTQINATCKPNQILMNSTMCIDTIRMRPFMWDSNNVFYFNGHYKFNQDGRSDNPQIGKTEDWFFINAMPIEHPIHVHLINFQIVNVTTLKTTNGNQFSACSLYEIDFYKEANNIPEIQALGDNDTAICNYIRTKLTVAETQKYLNDYLPEDSKDKLSMISGKDVLAGPADKSRVFKDDNCDNKGDPRYKYLCKKPSPDQIPLEERKWKQVVLVQPFTVMQVRIRWTSTDYNTTQKSQAYPYFNVPQDQLIQYPGYVYHCHFLHHEDNELMRPIMMQPSERFDQYYQPTGELRDCMIKSGFENKKGWEARYQCINKIMNCPVWKN